jgi:hypothetical protein
MRLFASHAKSVAFASVLTLAAAVGAVTAFAGTTVASNGEPVRLGLHNHERAVTAIARDNAGPALRLRTKNPSSAPLTTNATGRVRHLNADRVDGKDARSLLTRASVFRAGASGDTLDTGALWSLDIGPGAYSVAIRAIVTVTPNDPTATAVSVICGVIDLDTFNTPNTRVYVADSAVQIPGQLPAAMSGASTVRIGRSVNPGVICIAPDSSVELFKPVVVSFTNIDHRVVNKATPVPLGRQQLSRGLLPR